MAAPMKDNVDLGFLEKTDTKCLLSHLFPSKVGFRPAWLSLAPLPTPDDLLCGICGKPCVFLIQIYAPVPDKDQCFHRTTFVFICKNPLCSVKNNRNNFRVFRSQLPRKNDFYSYEPPSDETPADEDSANYPNASKYQNICGVCGCHGPKTCARCKQVHYCGKAHQTVDWKMGHKTSCGMSNEMKGQIKPTDVSYLFPEFELVTEPEELKEKKREDKPEENLGDFKKFMESKAGGKTLSGTEVDSDLMKMAYGEEQEDKVFMKFKKRISAEPGQVIRYDRGGEPLWVSSENIPTQEDIPNCDCGAARTFEFQVLPQLLNHLDVTTVDESIDWGTLLIYTCSADCDIGNNYHQEFLWKQDFSAEIH